jgi:hypothetical protein
VNKYKDKGKFWVVWVPGNHCQIRLMILPPCLGSPMPGEGVSREKLVEPHLQRHRPLSFLIELPKAPTVVVDSTPLPPN